MNSVHAIVEGNTVKFLEPVTIKGKYEAIITFTKPFDEKAELKQAILDTKGIWNDDDFKIMEEIVKDRENFSLNRDECDFS